MISFGIAPEWARIMPSRARRWTWPLAVAATTAVALVLRLWGVRHGLPYAYNVDENAHFVPRAIGLFGHDWNPHYFSNPPALTYLLHGVFAVWFGGGDATGRAFARDPTEVFAVARVATALVSVAAVPLVCLAGARLLGRAAGLLAGALLAVAFLPVFYAHQALNDAAGLTPLALGLYGAAGVLRHGRRRDYALAGAGLGLAWATKYTAAIVLLPLLAAAFAGPGPPARAARRLGLGVAVALAAALAADPYAVLDAANFVAGLRHQAGASGAAKLGITEDSGHVYYLWTLTWGLGWLPALAALGGALHLVRTDRRVAAVLVPAPVLFLIYMGLQERYFGRWVMPALPFLCLLAAAAAVALVRLVPPRWRSAGPVLAAAGLCAQGLVFSVHSDLVLSRADTRAAARAWLLAHVPAGAAVAIEPVVADRWLGDPERWRNVAPDAVRLPGTQRLGDGQVLKRQPRSTLAVGFDGYEHTLSPALLQAWEQAGVCWVMTGSTQAGRALADPRAAPDAVAFYRALARRADVVFRASPMSAGGAPPAFNFDWSFDYYPLSYRRPGPRIEVYRLRAGRCASRLAGGPRA
jgi:4-amino-4-deoxy-L-arabinose transferase-like glycosyltransferase